MKDDTVYIELLLGAIEKIETYIGSDDYDTFSKDDKTQSAVIMQLHVIGELAKRVSHDTIAVVDAPWKAMSGLRDVIAHQYFGVDLHEVWNTVTVAMPPVKKVLRAWLQKQINT